jgi:hypothetical protein
MMQLARPAVRRVGGRAAGVLWFLLSAVVVHWLHRRRRAAERRAGLSLASPAGFVAQLHATATLVHAIIAQLQAGRILHSAAYRPSPAQWAAEREQVGVRWHNCCRCCRCRCRYGDGGCSGAGGRSG